MMVEVRSCSWTTDSTGVNEGCRMTPAAREVDSDLTFQTQQAVKSITQQALYLH